MKNNGEAKFDVKKATDDSQNAGFKEFLANMDQWYANLVAKEMKTEIDIHILNKITQGWRDKVVSARAEHDQLLLLGKYRDEIIAKFVDDTPLTR